VIGIRGQKVKKKWAIRSAVTALTVAALGLTSAGAAQAADDDVLLYNSGGVWVAWATYTDDGDTFEVLDTFADGYGPTLYLQKYSLTDGWYTVKSATNRTGANGEWVGFTYDIDGNIYRMRLCNNGACKNSANFSE
jgi:hypothetical protein